MVLILKEIRSKYKLRWLTRQVGVVAGFILILTYRNEKKSRKKNIRVQ